MSATTIIAVLSLGLGIINTWFLIKSRRVRLRVIAKLCFDLHPGTRYTASEWDETASHLRAAGIRSRWAIEVINLSDFPLTIAEVGFTDRTPTGRHAIIAPELSRGRTWPVRLEPREKVICYCPVAAQLPVERFQALPCAYAKTDCDNFAHGSSRILESELLAAIGAIIESEKSLPSTDTANSAPKSP